MAKTKVVGINHVALVVGDIDEALEFYANLFAFELRGRSDNAAFIDLGDQFIALFEANNVATPPREQHFGLVVADVKEARRALSTARVELLDGEFLDFLDPWGNRVQIVEYAEIQFLKAPQVLTFLGLENLKKTDAAREELLAKGIAVTHTAEPPDRHY
jgi:catechol 2,3-dioxygenase-like lactoylglutathione lyase family enzyme